MWSPVPKPTAPVNHEDRPRRRGRERSTQAWPTLPEGQGHGQTKVRKVSQMGGNQETLWPEHLQEGNERRLAGPSEGGTSARGSVLEPRLLVLTHVLDGI